jgi:hypothetical protein
VNTLDELDKLKRSLLEAGRVEEIRLQELRSNYRSTGVEPGFDLMWYARAKCPQYNTDDQRARLTRRGWLATFA